MTLVHWIDRPIYAAINLKRDVEDAEESLNYRIDKYLRLFKGVQEFTPRESQVSEAPVDEIHEQLIEENLKKARFSGNTYDRDTATRPTAFGSGATQRPTAFGSGPNAARPTSDVMRFSDE